MDVSFVRASVFDLPSRQRVGALFFDGAADMQLWPGPGPEGDLAREFGEGLQRALDVELKKQPEAHLPVPRSEERRVGKSV